MSGWKFGHQDHDDIDRFWSAIQAKLPAIEASIAGNGDVAGWMREQVDKLSPSLEWELGPSAAGHRLTITAAWERQFAPLAAAIAARAPQSPRWLFTSARPPASDQWALATFRGRGATNLELDSFRFRARRGPHNTVAVECWWANRGAPEDAKNRALAHLATEVLLGEETFHQWVGPVTTKPRPVGGLLGRFFKDKAPVEMLPGAELQSRVGDVIDEIRSSLPDQPLARWEPPPDAEGGPVGRAFKISPPPPTQDDYAARHDLLVASAPSAFVPLFEATLAPFQSCRFSRFGETFCYLKVDQRNGWGFAERNAAQDALNAALEAAGLGRTLFGGTGKIYSYLHLALTDVPRAMEMICPILQERGADRRSWLLFHDLDLVDEWIGVWPDSPAPPT
jgi:hypothetical protein